uniref:Putative basic leucine zipper 61-like isoform X1 n=1 Tax=Cymbidium ensifolium TaxID=78740 RepID=A0A5C1YVG1_CYMEN|nr:putative basic leucine zipper 61-like isoform X1 [Cymbidium ensifolium]
MTQLPPKIPINYPSLFPSSPPSPTAHPVITPSQWSSVDEFFDFSASKLASHRRTISRSVATFEPLAAANSTIASTPSDRNSGVNEDHKLNSKPPSSYDQLSWSVPYEQSEAESSAAMADSTPPLPIQDPKRQKRILANRQSARRSRLRKLQYISELEKTVATLQMEVSALSSRVALFDHQRSILAVGNSHLRQGIAALAQDKIFKDANRDSLKKEMERLTVVYQQQQLKKMAAMTAAIDAGGDDTATTLAQNELQASP